MIYAKENPFKKLNKKYDLHIKVSGEGAMYNVKSIGKVYYRPSNNYIQVSEMGLLHHVKSKAKKAMASDFTDKHITERSSIIHHSKKLHQTPVIYDCIEIDLKSAYWNIAYNFGLVDDKYFDQYNSNKGKNKLIRNMSIGALAMKDTLLFAPKGKPPEFISSVPRGTTPVYWGIVWECNKIMDNIRFIADKYYLMKWCDAIFIENNPKALNKIRKYCGSIKYKIKIVNIHKIYRKYNQIIVYKTPYIDDKRVFNFQKKSLF